MIDCLTMMTEWLWQPLCDNYCVRKTVQQLCQDLCVTTTVWQLLCLFPNDHYLTTVQPLWDHCATTVRPLCNHCATVRIAVWRPVCENNYVRRLLCSVDFGLNYYKQMTTENDGPMRLGSWHADKKRLTVVFF